MLNTSTRERKLAIVAALAVAAVLLDRLWLRPLLTRWDTLDKAVEAASAELQLSENLIDNADAIREQWKKTSREVIAAEKDMSFQSYLSSLEQAARVKEGHRKVLPTAQADGSTLDSYAISLSGELRQMIDFLGRLQASSRLLRVTHLSIRSKEKTSTLEANMIVSTVPSTVGQARTGGQ